MRGDRPAAGDRHGRGFRADNDRRRRPADGFRVRDAARFAQIVEEAVSTLPTRLAEPVEAAEITVTAVPPETTAVLGPPQLADLSANRLTVYRRPLESRAEGRAELVAVVRLAVGEAVARALGIDDDLDDLFDDDW
jgi:predicted Zn-dependent protease with MMP-like domain